MSNTDLKRFSFLRKFKVNLLQNPSSKPFCTEGVSSVPPQGRFAPSELKQFLMMFPQVNSFGLVKYLTCSLAVCGFCIFWPRRTLGRGQGRCRVFVLLLAPFFLVPLGCTLDQSSHLLTHSCLSLVTTPSQFLAGLRVPTLLHFLISVFACALPMFHHPSFPLRECPCCLIPALWQALAIKRGEKNKNMSPPVNPGGKFGFIISYADRRKQSIKRTFSNSNFIFIRIWLMSASQAHVLFLLPQGRMHYL